MEWALETHGLKRAFGDLLAVDGLDLRVPRGTFYGFLGPNGAGKSTTMNCLTGLIRPTAGSMRILGLDPESKPVEVKRLVGVVPERLALIDRLTATESIRFVGQVHGLDRSTLAAREEELLELMDLAGDRSALVADFSTGMRKKLSLALALLPSPKLLFLDEPFEGIDALASRQIKELLKAFVARGGTVFLTSHILEIVDRMADHVGVIQRGRLVAQGALADLRAGVGVGKTLEEIFIGLVGGPATESPALQWLGG